MTKLSRLRGSAGYEACADAVVRVERRGKSSPAGWEQPGAVNSIRSNTVEGHMACPAVPWRWREGIGDGTPR